MGQYYMIVNVDKRQYLHPHKFTDGLKLLELTCSASRTLAGLAMLLADGNGRGSGDLETDAAIVGSWAGDRIVVAGDYADGGKFVEGYAPSSLIAIAKERRSEGYQDPDSINLYDVATEDFEDVSVPTLLAMFDDEYVAERYRQVLKESSIWWLDRFTDPEKERIIAKLNG